MFLILAVLFALLAGFMNGSYASPLKKIEFPTSITWLVFSILTFGFAPWIVLSILSAPISLFFSNLDSTHISLLFLGGILFGIGMLLFTYSLRFVGMAVSFLLNISAGTIIGSLLPVILLDPSRLLNSGGLIEILALIIFTVGLIFTTKASIEREKHLTIKNDYKGKNFIGIVLGSLSGLFTSAQGFVYSYSLPAILHLGTQFNISPLNSALFTWCLIFNAALLPYGLYFLIISLKNKSFNNLHAQRPFNGLMRIISMCMLYYLSIVIFSQASISFGEMGSTIAWPILMITIILTSNFWGWKQNEWLNAGTIAKRFGLVSILCLISAVILLTLVGYLNLT
jgi:L-rhamnose-H+ transport protein